MPNEAPPTSPPRVYQTIEETAGTFPPWVYDLLTFQRANWNTTADELEGQFIPLTTARQRGPQDAKLFIIGLIPPSATVTGRLLDRSATVAAVKGYAEEVDVNISAASGAVGGGTSGQESNALVVTAPGYSIGGASGPITVGDGKYGPGSKNDGEGVDPAYTQHSDAELYNLFSAAYTKSFGTNPTPNEVLFLVAQSKRETSGNWPNNNPGFIGNRAKPFPGSFKYNNAYWFTFDSAESGAIAMTKKVYGSAATRQAAQSGDVLGYCTSLAAGAYYGDDTVDLYYNGTHKDRPLMQKLLKEAAAKISGAGGPTWNIPDLPLHAPSGCAFNETGDAYRRRTGWASANGKGISNKPPDWLAEKGVDPKNQAQVFASSRRFTKYSLYDSSCPLEGAPSPVDPNGQALDWGKTGGDAAKQAQKAQEKLADKDLNQTELGKVLTANQEAYIRALQIAIQQMAQTPPLKLLVNPTSFKPAEEKIISDGNFGRNGPIVEHWGEQQTKLTASGKLAGFFSLDVGTTENGSAGNSPGLTRMARSFSASYQNFLSLYLIYRNNGTVWIEDLYKSRPGANNLAVVGSVYIYYDNVLYIGSFDSFNVNETDDKAFTLEYDFAFTVRYKFELDRIPDPRETYGNSSLFARKLSPQTISTDTSQSQPQPTTSRPLTDVEQAYLAKLREPVDPSVKSRSIFGDSTTTEQSIGLSRPPTGQNPEIIPSKLGVPGTSTKKK